jgi:DHA2 family multidrug resistance protein
MVGPILGPTLGGWLTEYYSWRWSFYINLPVGALAVLGILAFLPETERRNRGSFDFFGFALLSITIGALQLMLDRGNSLDWFGSTEIVLEATVSGLALYLFLVHMFTTDRPFIEPGLFADRNFSVGLLLMFLVGVMMFSGMALLPPFLQGLLGFPVITAGLIMAPRGFGTMVAMMVVGRLINRVDSRVLMAFGLLLMAWSLYDMAKFNTDVGVYEVVYTGVIQGFGMGFIFVPLSTAAFTTLAARYRAEGTAMFSLIRNIGMSIGISIVVTLLGREVQSSHAGLSESITPFRAALRAPDVPSFWSSLHGTGLVALNGEVSRQALTIAYVNDFRFMLYMSFVALPLLLLIRRPPAAKAVPAGPSPAAVAD